jgi:hypothetical protein
VPDAVSTVGWVVVLTVALPVIGALVFLAVVNSRVVIAPGSLGLLLVRGRATDTVLPPGPHWVASLRRRQVVEYPSVELAYRAGDVSTADSDRAGRDHPLRSGRDLQRSGPPLPVVLGDRAAASVRYTVRFCLASDQLPALHERVGPDGLWSLVRDTSEREIATVLLSPDNGVGAVFGDARVTLARRLADACAEAMQSEGLRLSSFHLVDVDLAGTGATIQDAVRARYDAELATAVAELPMDAVRKYQEVELWRRVAARENGISVVLPIGSGQQPGHQPTRVLDDPTGAVAGDR